MNTDSEYVEYIYDLMSDQEILLTYVGDVTIDVTNALLKGIKGDKVNFNPENIVQKKVYNIIVECLENIYRHSEVIEKTSQPSIFILGKSGESFYVITGNHVYSKQVNHLKSVIDQVNSLDKEGIKNLYREILAEGNLSEKGGAGLGIFDIALKSGQKLEYEFIPVENEISFYILKTQIPNLA